jgi:hypothetical protein
VVTPSVEQVGTIAQCNGAGKQITYRAWWEMISPSRSKSGGELFEVAPGDTIQASVEYTGGASDSYVLTVKDATNGQHFTTTRNCGPNPCQRASAEWVVESPGGGMYTLPDYQKITFTDRRWTSAAQPGAGISVIRYNMVPNKTPDKTLSVCTLPPNGSALSPAADIECRWLAAE